MLFLKLFRCNQGGSKNGRFLLVCGLALLKLDAMESAFKVLTQHQGDNLECLSLIALIFLKLGKVELATGELKKMQILDEESFITLLTDAMIRLYTSGDNSQQSNASISHLFEDIAEYHDLTVPILNGQALCNLAQMKISEAEKYLLEAMNKSGGKDPDTVANLVIIQSLGSKMARHKKYEANYQRLKDSFPNHPLTLESLSKEAEFQAIAQKYAL